MYVFSDMLCSVSFFNTVLKQTIVPHCWINNLHLFKLIHCLIYCKRAIKNYILIIVNVHILVSEDERCENYFYYIIKYLKDF